MADLPQVYTILIMVNLLKQMLPNFRKNYASIQAKCKRAIELSIPRIDMPVIEADQIPKFQERITCNVSSL